MMHSSGYQPGETMVWKNRLAYRPRSASTNATMIRRETSTGNVRRRSQTESQEPLGSANMVAQATGMVHPRYNILIVSTTNYSPRIVASSPGWTRTPGQGSTYNTSPPAHHEDAPSARCLAFNPAGSLMEHLFSSLACCHKKDLPERVRLSPASEADGESGRTIHCFMHRSLLQVLQDLGEERFDLLRARRRFIGHPPSRQLFIFMGTDPVPVRV